MRILKGTEEKEALGYIGIAYYAAKKATCKRSQCGSIIVKDLYIIGVGFNSPPGNLESQRRCGIEKKTYHEKVTDKTCCVHAEARAISDAKERYPRKLKSSRIYFLRLENGEAKRSGNPYCTSCSKKALDAGISEFVLWRKEGVSVFDTKEYNDLSYRFKG